MKMKILSAMIICAASAQVSAENSPYWLNVNGGYVTDRNGHCVRTINWTPEKAIENCEGGETEAAPAPAAAAPVDDAAAKDDSSDADSAAAAAAAAAAVAADTAETTHEVEKISLAAGATFELGGSILSDEGKAEIASLVEQFKDRDVTAVTIEGHTDSSGDAAFNQQLSEDRAEAVKAEIVANGGNPDKIKTVGYGESKPIADNGTREGRAQNRRVEIDVQMDHPKQ